MSCTNVTILAFISLVKDRWNNVRIDGNALSIEFLNPHIIERLKIEVQMKYAQLSNYVTKHRSGYGM